MSQNLPQMTSEQVKKLLWLVPMFDELETEQLERLVSKASQKIEECPSDETIYWIETQRAASKTLSARYIEDAKAMNYRTFVH